MALLAFDEAQTVARNLDTVMWVTIRRWAMDRMVCKGYEEIGSSDVSIEVIEALRSFEVPMVGPVIKAYEEAGIEVPEWAR